jgi:hypothetical protein
LIVAGAGIFHPEWIATAWQTCKLEHFSLRRLQLNKTIDLIFLAVTVFSSFVCLFFNKYLPHIDVRAFEPLRELKD